MTFILLSSLPSLPSILRSFQDSSFSCSLLPPSSPAFPSPSVEIGFPNAAIGGILERERSEIPSRICVEPRQRHRFCHKCQETCLVITPNQLKSILLLAGEWGHNPPQLLHGLLVPLVPEVALVNIYTADCAINGD